MAPSTRKKKVVSVTYVPDRTNAVAIGKRVTLKKRQTTIRPITFDISVVGSDSSLPVSKDAARDVVLDNQPAHDRHALDGPSQPSVVDVEMACQAAEPTFPMVSLKDQTEGNSDRVEETAGQQYPMLNSGHQSIAAEFLSIKAGHRVTRHQSSTQKTVRQQSQAKKARPQSAAEHQSATLEAGHQSLSVNAESLAVGHKFSVNQTVGDQSPTIKVMGGQTQTLEVGHQPRSVGADSLPGDREDQIVHLRVLPYISVAQISTNLQTGAQLGQTVGSDITQEGTRLQTVGEKGSTDDNAGTRSNPARAAEHSEVPAHSRHYLRSNRHFGKTEAQPNVKSTSKGTGRNTRNVTGDHVTPSRHMMQTRLDKTDAGLKFIAPCSEKNIVLCKRRNDKTFHKPSDSNVSDIFRAPLPVKDSLGSRLPSTTQTHGESPMQLPSISSSPAASASPSFDVVAQGGHPSGLRFCPVAGSNKCRQGKEKPNPTTQDQLLQDLAIRVKRRSPSPSDEADRHDRPTVSNLTEMDVLMSAMEDTLERFTNDSQPNARIKRFLHDVTENAFAKLRRASQASNDIGKLNKRLRGNLTELRRKRKELLFLQQEQNRLEAEVAAAMKEVSAGTADETNRDKINIYLMKLSCLTSNKSSSVDDDDDAALL